MKLLIIFVGDSGGRFLSHSRVLLLKRCPWWCGCIVCVWGGRFIIFSGVGFSIAICFMGASRSCMKKSFACIALWYRSCDNVFFLGYIHLAPALLRYVHGGCAIIKSQCCEYAVSNASCCICHCGWPPLGSCISQLNASKPFSLNALHIVCDSLQAMSILGVITGCCFYGIAKRVNAVSKVVLSISAA